MAQSLKTIIIFKCSSNSKISSTSKTRSKCNNSKTWWWIKSNLKWLKAISIHPMWACPMRWSICSRLLITEVCFYKLFLRKCLFHNSSMTIQEIWLSKAKCFSRSTSKSAKNASALVLYCSLKLYHRQVFQKGKL